MLYFAGLQCLFGKFDHILNSAEQLPKPQLKEIDIKVLSLGQDWTQSPDWVSLSACSWRVLRLYSVSERMALNSG